MSGSEPARGSDPHSLALRQSYALSKASQGSVIENQDSPGQDKAQERATDPGETGSGEKAASSPPEAAAIQQRTTHQPEDHLMKAQSKRFEKRGSRPICRSVPRPILTPMRHLPPEQQPGVRQEADDSWSVVQGPTLVKAGFPSMAAAWSWID